MIQDDKLEELTLSINRCINTNVELLKLEATERSSIVLSSMVSSMIVAIISILFVLFFSIAIAFCISKYMGINYAGFAIVAAFYFLVGLILIIGRKKIIESPIREKFISNALQQN